MKVPKLRNWYHATDRATALRILQQGYLVPQEHAPGTTAGIFFANTQANAGTWMRLRGLTQYAVFKIPRTRLDTALIHDNPASKFDLDQMQCMRYLSVIKVLEQDVSWIEDLRGLPEIPPGCELIVEGKQRIGIKLTDPEAFEAYIDSVPGLRQYVEQEAAE